MKRFDFENFENYSYIDTLLIHRAARVWNDLPADSTNFSTLNSFKRSLTPSFLVKHCAVYFF